MTQPQKKQDPRVAQTAAAALGAAAITTNTAAATTAVIQMLWRGINPYDHGEVSGFAAQAGRIVVSSQRTVANAHVAAQQLQLKAVGINQPVTVTIPDNVRGSSVTLGGGEPKVHQTEATVDYGDDKQTIPKDDADPGKVFERPAETYRYERSIGTDHETANDKAEQRISSTVDNNMLLSARLASQQTLVRVAEKDERIIGYRRIIHPEASKGGVCGLCIAAADRVYHVKELMPIHDRCECTVSPVTTAHDPGFTLNQDDLDRLYSHAEETAPEETLYNTARSGGDVIGTRKALSTSGKALKKTRYQIVHHHELGPVLTKVTGEKLPYFSTQAPAA